MGFILFFSLPRETSNPPPVGLADAHRPLSISECLHSVPARAVLFS